MVAMDAFISGQETQMIPIWKVHIPGPKLWNLKTASGWNIMNCNTVFSENSDQYLSFKGLYILL